MGNKRGFMISFLTAGVAMLLVTLVTEAAIPSEQPPSSDIDKVFADLATPGSPGCAPGVFRNGLVIYSKGYGLGSVELNTPITPESIFDIGSSSKQFTAASIPLLAQQGRLSVQDDVRKYIPELPDYSRTTGRPITILNLLNHTSGLRDYLALLSLSGVHRKAKPCSASLCRARFRLFPRDFCLGLQPVIEFASVPPSPLFVKVVSTAANLLVQFGKIGL
jgi:CubicO group peptidase (beta-lactamase class C family)